MNRDEIIRRWRANTGAAGVRLTDDDVERIVGRGALDRVMAIEGIVTRASAREVVPDYLMVLTAKRATEPADE
jgi:hypothetical protein